MRPTLPLVPWSLPARTLLLTLSLFFFLSRVASAGQPLETVRIASPGESAAFGPVWLARDAKIFATHGLAVEFITTIKPVSVLLSGEAQFVLSSGSPPLAARVAGADVLILAGIVNGSMFSLLAPPNIRRVDELRGKTVGVSAIGSATDMHLRRALRAWGLRPERDTSILATGGQQESLLTLKHGRVHAAVVDLYYGMVGKFRMGFEEIEGIGPFKDLPAAVSSSASYIQGRPEVVKRLLKATTEGILAFKSRRELAMQAIGKQFRTSDREILEAVYNRLVTRMEDAPYPDLDAIRAILSELAERNPKARDFRPEQMIDTSLLSGREQRNRSPAERRGLP